MSVLGYVKEQRLPPTLRGEDEIFQKELQAIRAKLRKAPEIYRPGQQPSWATATEEEELAAAATNAASKPIQHQARQSVESGRARRVERRPVEAAIITTSHLPHATAAAAATAVSRDVDGDERMMEVDEEEDEEEDGTVHRRHRDQRHGRRPVAAAVIVAAPSTAASSAAATASTAGVSIDTSQLEVPEAVESEEEEDEAEREIQERRRRAREKARLREMQEEEEERRRREEEELKQKMAEEEEEEEEEEEDEESEYETDSEDERRKMLLKPIFRSRAERATLADRDRIESEQAQLEEDRLARKAERKQQGKELVLAELQRDLARQKARAAQAAIDSEDEMAGSAVEEEEEVDEEMELDLWKLRELKRIKRARDEKAAYEAEEAEIARRRLMSDEEIARDNERLGVKRLEAGTKTSEHGTMKFMQRYYHKGGFFQDEDSLKQVGELAQRDFHQATGMERTVDVELLPKVMQVKKFGLKGRTKYTHLLDQDTTRTEENPWSRKNAMVDRTQLKGAGDVVPSHHRKKHKS